MTPNLLFSYVVNAGVALVLVGMIAWIVGWMLTVLFGLWWRAE